MMEEEVDEEYERLCGSVVGSLYIEDKRISDFVMRGYGLKAGDEVDKEDIR